MLSDLDDRERRIIEARYLTDEPITLHELGDELGITRERIRQIEARAFVRIPKMAEQKRTTASLLEAGY